MSTKDHTDSSSDKPRKGIFREYIEAILVALLVALTLRYFVIEAFRIPSASMVPTLLVGDHIFVNKFIYGVRVPFLGKKILQFRAPKRGEIIVFIYPHDRSKDYIKRVVGLPGDEIEIRNNQLFVNREAVPQELKKQFAYSDISQACEEKTYDLYEEKLGVSTHEKLSDPQRFTDSFGPMTIEPEKLFVMGDNRDNSSDSRTWGLVPLENVKGKALFIWLSVNRCGFHSMKVGDVLLDLVQFHWLRPSRMMTGLH